MAVLSFHLSRSVRASAASTKDGSSGVIRRRRLDRFGPRKAGDYGRILARASKPSEVAQPSPGQLEREDPSPFFDAMLRSFVLGMAGSVVFESFHVMAKVWGLSDGQDLGQLIGSLPGSLDGIQPMYFADHLAAVALMIFLYTVDAVAMVDVLKRYPDDKEGAKWMLQNMATLSKKMLPLKLTLFKTFVLSVTPSVAQAGLLAGKTVPGSCQPASKQPFAASLAAVADAAVCTPAPAQDTAQKPEVPDMLERERERLQRLLRRDAALRDAPATVPEKNGAGEKAGSAPGKLRRNGLKPGQLDPGSSDWARRRVEEAEEKMLLKNFWYAAVASSAVTSSKPVGVEMLGLTLVLFRNSAGRVVILDSVCPHRAAPLSQGWLKTANDRDCVVCPYHAWAFDEEGRVQDIPAQPKKNAWPRRPLLQSYDVQESGGLVWLFYGNKQLPLPERPPLPPLGSNGSSGLVSGRRPAFRTVVEQANLASVGHVAAFKAALEAAGAFLRRSGPATGLELSMGEVGPFAVERAVLLPDSSLPMPLWVLPELASSVKLTLRAQLPGSVVARWELGGGQELVMSVHTSPDGAGGCVQHYSVARNFLGFSGLDAVIREAMVEHLMKPIQVLAEKSKRPRGSAWAGAMLSQLSSMRSSFLKMGYGVLPETFVERFRDDMTL